MPAEFVGVAAQRQPVPGAGVVVVVVLAGKVIMEIEEAYRQGGGGQ